MDVRALLRNIKYSVKVGRSLSDSIKYILLIYRATGKKTTCINFNFGEPVNDVKLCIRNNDSADAFILSEVFKEKCYNISLLKTDPKIIDLGANAGFSTVYFSKIFKNAEIACIEPVPSNIELLKQNLQLNKVNAKVFPAAISTADGTIQMDLSEKDFGHKVSDLDFGRDFSGSPKIEVDALAMSSLLETLHWSKIDILKMDIEGYEGKLFFENNFWLEKTDTIIMEIHEEVDIDLIKNVCIEYGFKSFQLFKGLWVLSKLSLSKSINEFDEEIITITDSSLSAN